MMNNLIDIVVGFEAAQRLRDAEWTGRNGLIWHRIDKAGQLMWASADGETGEYKPLMFPEFAAPTAADILAELPIYIDYKKHRYTLRLYKAEEIIDLDAPNDMRVIYGVDYQRRDTIQDHRSFLFNKLAVEPKETESPKLAEACAAAWLVLRKHKLV